MAKQRSVETHFKLTKKPTYNIYAGSILAERNSSLSACCRRGERASCRSIMSLEKKTPATVSWAFAFSCYCVVVKMKKKMAYYNFSIFETVSQVSQPVKLLTISFKIGTRTRVFDPVFCFRRANEEPQQQNLFRLSLATNRQMLQI